MVGKAFESKRQKVFIQTKVHVHDEKQMRTSVEEEPAQAPDGLCRCLGMAWHSSPEEVSDPRLFGIHVEDEKEARPIRRFFHPPQYGALLREAAKSNFHDVALVSYNFTHSKDLKEAVALAAQSGIALWR